MSPRQMRWRTGWRRLVAELTILVAAPIVGLAIGLLVLWIGRRL